MNGFEPTLQAAHARLAAVNPDAYARTRNALDGAVTRLSPYLTHGWLNLREVFDCVQARQPLHAQHKFVFELGWRAYYRHVWAHLGDAIHQSLHPGLLADTAYQTQMPDDVLQARSGIPVIDLAVRELYATGYLHNHVRMWLASYLVHLRKIHWHTAATWMLGHLLDGDEASNHLSWQWIAGTGSSKPYLFNAANVARYAPQQWHSPGTGIDTSYEALNRLAQTCQALQCGVETERTDGAIECPALRTSPSQGAWTKADGSLVQGRDVWLQHPWSLGARPSVISENTLLLAIGFVESHARNAWSERRWQFVTDGLQGQTAHLWWDTTEQIAQALRGARSLCWRPDPHVDAAFARLETLLRAAPEHPLITPQLEPLLFAPVASYCPSFSQWWRKTGIANAPQDA